MLHRIILNEKSHNCLTSTEIRINENLIRYDDDQLPDMYDNNYFSAKREITENDYDTMLHYKEKRGDKHLKVVCDLPSDLLSAKKMEAGILLTMLKTNLEYPEKCSKTLHFKCLKDEDIKEDLMSYVHNYFACPMFLHADEDDTPKDMYRNFGYITVKKSYEYLISEYTN